jgi:hypothetical protein
VSTPNDVHRVNVAPQVGCSLDFLHNPKSYPFGTYCAVICTLTFFSLGQITKHTSAGTKQVLFGVDFNVASLPAAVKRRYQFI